MWAQPWKCLFSNSHAVMKWLPWVCINSGFETGNSSHPADRSAQQKQSFLLLMQAWWHSHVRGCRCVSTLLTSVYPSQSENRSGSGLATISTETLEYPSTLQYAWKMKIKEFWYIQMVYICYYRHVNSRIVREKQYGLRLHPSAGVADQ